MRVRVLGAHKLESYGFRHTCFLIDGVLAVDAGSLASSLTREEQSEIRSILVTHHHFDHIRDIPTVGLVTMDDHTTIDLYSVDLSLEAIHENLVNGSIYPDLTVPFTLLEAKYRLCPIEPGDWFPVNGYRAKAISMPHTVPCVGFAVRSPDGGTVGYTGDTRGNLLPFFAEELSLQYLFVDVSFPNRLGDLASDSGHLTPVMLRQELEIALEAGLKLPKLVAVHMSSESEDELLNELAAVADDLKVDLTAGYQGLELICTAAGAVYV